MKLISSGDSVKKPLMEHRMEGMVLSADFKRRLIHLQGEERKC